MSYLFVTAHRVNLQVPDDIIGLINEIIYVYLGTDSKKGEAF